MYMTMYSDPWSPIWNFITILAFFMLALSCCFCDLMQDTIVQPEEQQAGIAVTADDTEDAEIDLETRVTVDPDGETTPASINNDP